MASKNQPLHEDQRQHWNHIHRGATPNSTTVTPTGFAKEVNSKVAGQKTVLELGCGRADDAVFFAEQGNHVIAIDFSDVVIKKACIAFGPIPTLHFAVADISEGMPFPRNKFSLVYARLSLHYFPDNITRNVFHEICRVLKPGGWLCFMCKSTRDPLCGRGTMLGVDLYEHEGHVRHFFSETYTKDCLRGNFRITELISREAELYGSPSAYIQVVSQKIYSNFQVD